MEHIRHPNRWLKHLISLPFIWGMIIPIVIADICSEIYHRICFPLYGLPYIKRSEYIIIDRHKLAYLDPFQKLGCVYCGYANGWIRYIQVMAGETEKYWCGIMHKKGKLLDHQKDFLPYGDKKEFEKFSRSK